MTLHIEIITDFSQLKEEVKKHWDSLVKENSENPLLLYDFTFSFMQVNSSKGWAPRILLGYENNELVGIAPLIIKKIAGVQLATFIIKAYDNSDFIVKKEYQKVFLSSVLEYLFKKINVKIADLTFHSENSNFDVFKEECTAIKISYEIEDYMKYCIVPVSFAFERFEANLSKSSRYKIRRSYKKVNSEGQVKIISLEDTSNSAVVNKIMQIEKESWKETWRFQKGMVEDPELPVILNCSETLAKSNPDFKRRIMFLEFNNQPIAFLISITYKHRMLLIKTSFDKNFQKYSPGIILWHEGIRKGFEDKNIQKIDFQTDLPFMNFWHPTRFNRTRMLVVKGLLPKIIIKFYKNVQFRKLLRGIAKT
jgi:CelD/BcsL family acetyltransferase involved in cellulose biosynthesis